MKLISKQVDGFIDKNYDKITSVEEIAKACNENYSYFRIKIRNKTGITLKKRLLKKKIEKAKELLINTQEKAKVYEIAFKVGFKSPEGFIKIFKKFENCTPTEYREKFRKRHSKS